LDDSCGNFSNLFMNPLTMKFVGEYPSTLRIQRKI